MVSSSVPTGASEFMARKLSELNYYQVLQVAGDAGADAIKAAFHAFARRYHPDQAMADPERRRTMTRIYQRGTEAYRVLCHPGKRRRYDQGLADGLLRLDPSAARTQTTAGGLPALAARARPFLRKAQQSMRDGHYRDAALQLKIALGQAPGHPTLLSMLAEVEAHLQGARPTGPL